MPLEHETASPAPPGLAFTEELQATMATSAAIMRLDSHREQHSQDMLLSYGQMSAMLVQLMGSHEAMTSRFMLDVFCKMRCNVFTCADFNLNPWAIGLFPTAALVNHSCEPNALATFRPAKSSSSGPTLLVLRSIRDIAAGEEITVSYTDVASPTPIRRTNLLDDYFFRCACPRCACFAAYTAAHGEGGQIVPSPAHALPAEAYTGLDRRMLGALCEKLSCKQAALAALSSAPSGREAHEAVGVPGVHIIEVYTRDMDEEDNDSDEDDREPKTAVQKKAERKPQQFLYPSVCTTCSALPTKSYLAHIEAVLDGIDDAVQGLKNSAQQGEEAGSTAEAATQVQAAEEVLASALQILSPHHHRVVALLNALTNSAVTRQDFAAAERHCTLFVAAARASHPSGHPVPALQAALQGKILHVLSKPAAAVVELQASIDVLSACFGLDHPTIAELHALLAQARQEAQQAKEE